MHSVEIFHYANVSDQDLGDMNFFQAYTIDTDMSVSLRLHI